MSKIDNLLKTLIDNIDNIDIDKVSNNIVSDLFDLAGGSYRSVSKNHEDKLRDIFYDPDDFSSEIVKDHPSIPLSTLSLFNPIGRILTKPKRMGADFKELLTDPEWSLKNNKIGLTKDALILNYLFGSDDEESNVDEELDNYE